jgi:bifunctional oligoribonuclease and PAP phosphatase NrnA
MTSNHLMKKAYKALKGSRKVLLAVHDRPDGDAVASACAMLSVLDREKVKADVFCNDLPSGQFSYLPFLDRFTNDKNALDFGSYDIFLALDCGSLKRTGLAKEIIGRKESQLFIEIDHHPRIDDGSDIEIRDTGAAATTELVYEFIRENRIPFDRDLANCVLTGLLTDTGNFLYSSTTEKTMKIASKMILHGARFPVIVENTLKNKSLGALRIWGEALGNLEVNQKYKLAFSYLSRQTLESSRVSEDELEGLAGFLSSLCGVRGILLLREENGQIKGSLRGSDKNTDVSLLAKMLGGGGHAKAAGFTIRGRLDDSGKKAKVLD